MGEEGSQNLFKQINELWINLELSSRQKSGVIPPNFRIYRCLIKMLQNQPAIVQFNNEIGWKALAKFAPDTKKETGQVIFLEEIQTITDVKPPEVDGERVAFVYLYWDGHAYQIIFDFSPNSLPPGASETESLEGGLGKYIADSLQLILNERVIRIHERSS
jgi:hypothetical protein